MADKTTIARPYAKAAFDAARGHQRLGPWSDTLRLSASVVGDARVQALLGSPQVTAAEAAQFVIDLAGSQIDADGRNFLQTLAENHRLAFLPEIAKLFDSFKDEAENVVDVNVTSAAPLNDSEQQTLKAALTKKLKRDVRLHCATDPALIGGAVLQAGDLVIDGSLRAKLDKISNELAR